LELFSHPAGNDNGFPRQALNLAAGLNLAPPAQTYLAEAISREAVMTHWHDTMVDRPQADGASYATGWTISGLAVLGTIVAVWVLGI
jgi:hypothetical protein